MAFTNVHFALTEFLSVLPVLPHSGGHPVVSMGLWLVFLAGLLAVLYAYLGYPVVVALLARLVGRDSASPSGADREFSPSVTMIVAAHNEETVIRDKLNNTRAIEYDGPFECIVVSDSTDETDALVERHAGPRTRLLSLAERNGKSHALNRAVEEATGDVLVFSDANTMYDPDAVSELVAPLSDDSVGCTTGSLRLVDDEGESTESAYWTYELKLRKLESRLGTTVSINGGMLALRRRDFSPIPERALTDDFVVALRQAAAGRRIVFTEAATATESTTGNLWSEYDRRIRIGAGNYQTLVWFRRLLSPLRGVVAFEFFSHKVLRWCMPGILLVVLVANLALATVSPSLVTVGLLAAQVACYALAGLGMGSERARERTAFALPAYFLSMNLAFALGFAKFVSGPTVEVWKATRNVEE